LEATNIDNILTEMARNNLNKQGSNRSIIEQSVANVLKTKLRLVNKLSILL